MGFDTTKPYFGQPKGISHDGSVVAGYMDGVVTNGASIQYAAYWVDGVESLVPAPPDDPTPTIMSATGVSGDGTTLIVQDQVGSKTESYVFKIATGTFTPIGFLGGTNQQTYATAINNNGAVVAGHYNLDNGTSRGFLWNASTGLTDLGIPATHPNTYYLQPTCMSDDGTILFGQLTEYERTGWAFAIPYIPPTASRISMARRRPPARPTDLKPWESKIFISRRFGRPEMAT